MKLGAAASVTAIEKTVFRPELSQVLRRTGRLRRLRKLHVSASAEPWRLSIMDKADLSLDFVDRVKLQKYGSETLISGVQFIDFSFHSDDGGDFFEIVRLSKGCAERIPEFELRQLNRSRFNPGHVKAFHLHLRQDEIWSVHPLDRLLVGLIDVRKGSETEADHMRFVLGGGKTMALYIPRGVAHGGLVLDQKPVDVIYLTNEQFSPLNPDEWRLQWDILGEDFWQVRKG